MKNFVLALAAVSAFGVAQASAATVVEDTDGSGAFSMEELVVAYAELTEEQFAAIDANADGQADADEMVAAIAAGVIAE